MDSLARRLYGDASRTGLVAAFGLVAIFSLSRALSDVFDETRDAAQSGGPAARPRPSRRRGEDWLRWINASVGASVRLIAVEEVRDFKADNRTTLVMTATHESLIRKPTKELLEELDPAMFWQIHRSTVFNVNAVEEEHRSMTGHCEMRLEKRPERLPVSAPYVHLFRQM